MNAAETAATEARRASKAAKRAEIEQQIASEPMPPKSESLKIFRLMTDGGVQAAVLVARIGSALFWRGLFGGVG